jgi:hypothetical protein
MRLCSITQDSILLRMIVQPASEYGFSQKKPYSVLYAAVG